MPPHNAPPPPGSRIIVGTVVGAFVGLLIDKFALGMLFGFFVGAMLSRRTLQQSEPAPPPAPDESAP